MQDLSQNGYGNTTKHKLNTTKHKLNTTKHKPEHNRTQAAVPEPQILNTTQSVFETHVFANTKHNQTLVFGDTNVPWPHPSLSLSYHHYTIS